MKTWDAVYQEWQTDDGQIHAMRMGLLIRCKECIYYRGDHEYCVNDMFAIENGFCNWAERKEE